MADYALPAVVEKRVRYFDGQYLQDQDFIDEQDYQLDREHRHNRLLHGPGIADGLTVTSSAPNQVTVAPGTAIDSDGNQLVLAQATTVDLPAAGFNDKTGVQLYISYLQSAEDPQTVAGSADFTRWLERPQLSALAPGQTYSGTAPPVLLAALALDNAGHVEVDSSVRSYSGLRLPGSAADAAILHATSAGPVELAGSLTVDGSVGIGNPSPAYPLHLAVGKALRIEGGTGSAPYFSFGGNGDFSIDAPGVPSGRFVVQNAGNVGIGTASPGARLEVVGGGGTSVDLLVSGRLRSNNNNGGLWVAQDRFVGGFDTSKIGFYNGGAWQLSVLNNGNIGIGNPNPAYPLHLAVGKALRIEGGTGSAPYFSFGGNGDFSIDAPGVPSGRFVVRNAGNVGIGTAQPAANLHISAASQNTPIQALQIDVQSFQTMNNARASYFLSVRDVGGGATHFCVRGDGGVGIGTTDTSNQKLCVAGPAWFKQDVFISGRLVFQVSPTDWWFIHPRQQVGDVQWAAYDGTSGPNVSDARLKTGLRPISDALDLVRTLQGVRYRWGDSGQRYFTRDIESSVLAGPDATDQQNREVQEAERRRTLEALAGDRMGLVAQDVETVIPELVHEDADGYKHLRYQHLTALLVEAIKEQDAVVEALSAKVAALGTVQSR